MASNKMLKRSIASWWRDTEGSAFLEAALAIPVLIPLVFGALEFAFYFHKQQLVESGVRDAARYMARSNAGLSDANPCNDATTVANAQNIAATGVISGGTARVRGWTAGSVIITCPSFDNSGGGYLGAATIYRITVSTSFADPAVGFFNIVNLTAPNLRASHTERSIGPG
jgi:Flp pilus assembly protein TadG